MDYITKGGIGMMKEIFIKFKNNFSKLLIYLVLSVIFTLITVNYDLPLVKSSGIDSILDFKSLLSLNFLKIIGISLIEIYITAYGLIIAKKVTLDNSVDQKESFSEALSYYPRLLIINLIFTGVILIFTLLLIELIKVSPKNMTLLMFSSITILVGFAVFSIFIRVTESYIVYYDEGIGFSFKQGIKIGKNYFLKILGLLIIGTILGRIIGGDIFDVNTITLTFGTLITVLYSIFLTLYIMNLCKVWGKVN